MKDLKWPAVAVIVALLAVLGFLSYVDKDPSTVLAGVIAVLSALGFGYQFSKTSDIAQSTARIEENTNGRMGQLARELEQQRVALANANAAHRQDMKEMADRLAVMVPAPPEPAVSGTPMGEGHSSDV
jgi:hypothetical protein